MTKLEIAFNEAFKNRGGIYRGEFSNIPLIEELLKYARAEIFFLRKSEKNIPPIYVDLIDNYGLNASASKLRNQYFIGINIGAILHTHSIFCRMLSSNTILKNIGNVDVERPPKKIFDAQLKNIRNSLLSFTRELIPKDPIRIACLKIFMKHVLDFILFHEFAHIIYGHLDYKLSKSVDYAKHPDTFFLQALEVSADSFSTVTSLKFLHEASVKLNPLIPQEVKYHYRDRYQIIKMWLFPVYTYFRLFGFANLRHSITKDAYPSPACRANLIVECIHSFWDYEYTPFDKDDLSALCTEIIFDVEKAFDQVSEQGLDTRFLQSSLSCEYITHMKQLYEKEHEIIKSELLKEYSYIPLYK